MSTRELNQFEEGVLSNIRESGCHITGVFDPDGEAPAFAYSVGFTETVGQSEVIVFGLDFQLMAATINETLDQCRKGLVLTDGLRIAGLLEGFDCIVRLVPVGNIVADYFNSAMWFHRRRTGEELSQAFQIVWPGYHDGLFPWEPGADPETIASQRVLYEMSISA
ncbi:DUF4262 domain-containing protein [Sphingomonas sp.]|uniref:DUF4262 domain-containing protein n=1 Tax=Sphingomonas sp. TaxID=28214 RepID=UPI00182CF5B0|nr:DUF4262 domain-containing protein [Sphingomonas sp.]MBA4763285.1 DUF4262 domain-containing protein [Sphingomonas sp.]